MFKKQAVYVFIYFSNLTFNLMPFFLLKKIFLVLLGAKIGKNSTLHTPIKFFNLTRKLNIGSNVTINPGCYLDDRGGIFIGNNVNISHSVRIYTAGHNINSPDMRYFERSVLISDNVWIFPNVLIMPGVKLGKGCVILPGAVVTKSYPERSIVGGNPSKIVGSRDCGTNYCINHSYWFVN
ncbi:acyltransferase [Photobacterium lipolyticum]|uniref:Acyltransferase n=1 Tax=Photobacterium lipolyticum TaxID=266810 RepID=A0A2T3MVD0_9GAMM|nr:acyltransferase [Photobacterium lipolyticum]PSW03867.1 acyltransferase [Photobacterium lipolyticum]